MNEELLKNAIEILKKVNVNELETIETVYRRFDDGSKGIMIRVINEAPHNIEMENKEIKFCHPEDHSHLDLD